MGFLKDLVRLCVLEPTKESNDKALLPRMTVPDLANEVAKRNEAVERILREEHSTSDLHMAVNSLNRAQDAYHKNFREEVKREVEREVERQLKNRTGSK
jgi:hypothetical protein